MFDPMRLKSSALPDAGNPHVVDSKFLGQLARAPVRGTIRGFPLCSGQNLRFQLRRILPWRTAGMPRVQSGEPTILKTLFPSRDVATITAQRSLNGCEGFAIGQHQNQSCTANILGRLCSRSQPRRQFFSLRVIYIEGGRSHGRLCHGADLARIDSVGQNGGDGDPDHDIVAALNKWVEGGIAPSKIVATKFVDNDPAKSVVMARPLCPYPQVAKYKGVGDTNDATNFVCAVR